MQFSLKKFPEIPRVEKPNERYQKGGKEEHNGLLLNNTIMLFIDIIVGDTLNQNCHDCSCEEKTKTVFEHEMELSRLPCFVLLEFN